MKKPNFFIIGAPKCGTTSLASYLSDHPEVCFSVPKEPGFWCDDLGVEPHAFCFKSLGKYLEIFGAADPKKHNVIAEGSTSYLRSRNAVKRILEYSPTAKFIVMLRNPVDVAYAYHMEQIFTGLERETDFGRAWQLQDEREYAYDNGQLSPNCDSLLYRRIAALGTQLKRAVELVPVGRIKVVLLDELKDDPRKVYADILEFLNISPYERSDFTPLNVSHAQRIPYLSRFVLNPPDLTRPLVDYIRLGLLKRDYKFVKWLKAQLNVQRPRVEMPDSLRAELASYYKNEIVLLQQITGKDLSSWM